MSHPVSRLPLVLAVLLLAPLLAASAQAQGAEPVRFAFDSPSGSAERGNTSTATIIIDNDASAPADVRLYVNNSRGRDVIAQLVPSELRVPANSQATMKLVMYVAHNATPGEKRLQLYGSAQGNFGNKSSVFWNTEYALTVSETEGRLPIRFTPESTTVYVPPTPVKATFSVRNTGEAAERVYFGWTMPDGFREVSGTLPRTVLSPQSDTSLTVEIERESWATFGGARLLVHREATGAVIGFATLDLAAVAAAPPEPDPGPEPARYPIVHQLEHDFNGPSRRFTFEVRPGAMGLAWGVGFDPYLVHAATSQPTATMYDPLGQPVPGCGAPCSGAVDQPMAGTWALEFTGTANEVVQARVNITDSMPHRVVLAPWRLATLESHHWDDSDATHSFAFDAKSEAAIFEVWRPNNTLPDGLVVLRDDTGAERARCDVGRCFVRLAGALPDGWSFEFTGPGVGGLTAAVWALPPREDAGDEPLPDIEPPLQNVSTNISDDPLRNATTPTIPPARAILEVEPGEVALRPGASAQAVLRIRSNSSDAYDIALVVAMPPGVTASIVGAPETLAPGETIEVLVELRASLGVETNVTLDATIRSPDASGGAFSIRIGEPLPPVDDDLKGDANAPADGGAASLAPTFAAAAAGVGVAALGVAAARKKWPLAFAALYAKLRPSKVLEHEARRRMTEMARAEPGITMGEIQRRLQLANGEVAHHLHVLERARVLASARDGQLRRVYSVEFGRAPVVPDMGERALAALRERPRTLSALAAHLGVSRQALHYHVKKLVAQRLVEPEPDGTLRAIEAEIVVFERV